MFLATMKTAFLFILLIFMVTVSSENSSEKNINTCGFFGYELIEQRLDHMQEKLSSMLERLDSSVSKNEQKIEDLKMNVIANNSKLFERITKLETLEAKVSQNQRSMEDRMNGIEINLQKVTNNTKNIIDILIRGPTCKTTSVSGVIRLQFPNLKVYCEANSFGGGWLVIQQRADLTLSFNRSWTEYRNGFGVVGKNEDFWLGLEPIHQITSSGQYELAVEFREPTGNPKHARYSQFKVAGEGDKYRLTVEGYLESSGDIFGYFKLNNMKFTTYDSDNDNNTHENCAIGYGGWWYNNCGLCNLNYLSQTCWCSSSVAYGTYSRMMIRQK